MQEKPKRPQLIRFEDGNIGYDYPEPSPEEQAKRKEIIAKCGHVKRRIVRNERLTGKLLEFALDVVGGGEIADKLKKGQKLTDYENHLVVDVYLLHKRLSGR